MPRLSVIVPCHQVEAYARDALRSLQRNDFPGLEVLLVDDGSRDGTPAILAEEADRLRDARIITHPKSRGVSAARNSALEVATGDYLTFLDGDDWLAPGYLAQLLATIERLGCDVLRTDHVRVNGRQRALRRLPHGPRGTVGRPPDAILPVSRATSIDSPHSWSGAYSVRLRDAGLMGFDADLRTSSDRLWAWRWHLHAESMAVVGLAGVFYRRDVPTALTQVKDDRRLDFLLTFERIVAELRDDPDGDRLLPKALRQFCSIVCYHLAEWHDALPADVAADLVRRSQEAMARFPQRELAQAVAALDPERRARIDRLVAA